MKIFKGTMTSDGLPEHEMAACVGAGRHPNLIPVLGIIPDHPAQLPALVMPLIDARLRNMANPPSLESCTRDISPDGTHFNTEIMFGIARGIASAAERLHGQGIMHGDLYAHNILYCEDTGNVVLGDFGAASLFERGTECALSLQRLEVRAFGCLLAELLERCGAPLPEIRQLASDCLQPQASARPLFADIVLRLQNQANTTRT